MSVEKLLGVMKQAGQGAVQAGNPVTIMFGEVETTAPLSVRVDQRFVLPVEFLIVPESLTPLVIELRHAHQYMDVSETGSAIRMTELALPDEPIVIRRGLEQGDKVLLLRIQGGQQYIILDRVVNA